MRLNTHSQILILTALFTLTAITTQAQSLRGQLLSYLTGYTRSDQLIRPSTLDSIAIDTTLTQIRVHISGGFKEQFFTDEVVENIYRDVKAFVPDSLSDYRLTIITDKHPIEQLIPNAIRRGEQSTERLVANEYKGTQHITRTSLPITPTKGLNGRHIAISQSHGNYYDTSKSRWKWQRPRLFCTTEDLLTQTFVLPYIIPMLENAGATIYNPRERDWQANEVIVDNDPYFTATDSLTPTDTATPISTGTYYEEGEWTQAQVQGFALTRTTYHHGQNPFTHGTTRTAQTNHIGSPTAIASWTPDIPSEGRYAVYISYPTLPESVTDAHYTVIHKGIRTTVSINQQMGGSTWIYIGTYLFGKDNPEDNKVELTNESKSRGIVTADAVRFGAGIGNIMRNGQTSHMPRWAEAATYTGQWAGMPDSVYNHFDSTNDYKSDLHARPNYVNYLAGGSPYMPDTTGLNVPIELSVAFHTDAGYRATEELIGTLSICSTHFYGGKTHNGQDRFASYDLASLLLNGLQRDIGKDFNWQVRSIWNRNYCETREPLVPSALLEMLSHQNFADMRHAYDPKFKFQFCRSVYKTIVRYLATQHNTDYVIQPLPVHNFAVTLDDDIQYANLTWDETPDDKEPTAKPTAYIIFTRIDDSDFDNGTLVNDNSLKLRLTPGHIYSFKVAAVNKGGMSFPSEVLSAYIAPQSRGKALIVNAFDRLEGPAWRNTGKEQGFDLDLDPGVQYGPFAGFCGRQITFDTTHMGSEATNGTGYSGSELEGKVIMGNTFDYTAMHGEGIKNLGTLSFTSCSEEALVSNAINTSAYQMLDVIFGVDKQIRPATQAIISQYLAHGGRLLVSCNGKNIIEPIAAKTHVAACDTIHNYNIDRLNGSGLDFSIHRTMNSESYALPSVLTMEPAAPAFAMLQYSDNRPAAIAYDGTDYKTVVLGFPLESIKDKASRNKLMQAITSFLCR